MSCDDDRPRAVSAHEARRTPPELLARPQKRLGVLVDKHVEQVLARCPCRTAPIEDVDTRRGEKCTRLERVDPRMHEDVAARRGIDHVEERQRLHPIHELRQLVLIECVEAVRRGNAAVQCPGEAIHVPGLAQDIDKHALVVAHEHMRVGKRAHELNHAKGLRTSVDHVAENVDRIRIAGRGEAERLVERGLMPMDIGKHVDRHVPPLRRRVAVPHCTRPTKQLPRRPPECRRAERLPKKRLRAFNPTISLGLTGRSIPVRTRRYGRVIEPRRRIFAPSRHAR